MAVLISWIDPEETLAYFQFIGEITAEEYFEARRPFDNNLKRRGDPPFDTIYDLSQVTNLSIQFTGAIATITNVIRELPRYERFPAVIENRSHVIKWIKIGVKAMSFLSVTPPHFVETYDEAVLKIAELRRGLDE